MWRARRKEKGIQYQKHFTSSKNSLDENKELARKWLNEFKEKQNRSEINECKIEEYISYSKKLPINIFELIKNSKLVGYKVIIRRNNETYNKQFQDKNLTLDELLKKAINYKNDFLKGNNQ